MEKVRVINKTGKVLMVANHIANDVKLMKSYGFTIQDFNRGAELPASIINKVVSSMPSEIDKYKRPYNKKNK